VPPWPLQASPPLSFVFYVQESSASNQVFAPYGWTLIRWPSVTPLVGKNDLLTFFLPFPKLSRLGTPSCDAVGGEGPPLPENSPPCFLDPPWADVRAARPVPCFGGHGCPVSNNSDRACVFQWLLPPPTRPLLNLRRDPSSSPHDKQKLCSSRMGCDFVVSVAVRVVVLLQIVGSP